MGDERHAPRPPVAPPAEPPGHHRAEPVGADRQSRSHRPAGPVRPAEHRARDRPAVVEQLLQRGALEHLRSRPARRFNQLGVENPARNRKPGGAEGPVSRPSELTLQPGATERGDGGPYQRLGTRRLQRVYDAEPVQDPDGLGTHVLGAGLVAGEDGAVHQRDAHAGSRQEGCRGAAGGAGTGHEDVCWSDLNHSAPRPGERAERGRDCGGRQVDPIVVEPSSTSPVNRANSAAMYRPLARLPTGGAVKATLQGRAERRIRQHPCETYQRRGKEQ